VYLEPAVTQAEDSVHLAVGSSGESVVSRVKKSNAKNQIRVMGSEEDPRDYDTSRKHFQIGFIIASVSGILMWVLMFLWIFNFNGGLTWGTNPNTEINLHIVLMIFFAIYLQGHGTTRTIPSISLTDNFVHFLQCY
jgi:hypothetical protein